MSKYLGDIPDARVVSISIDQKGAARMVVTIPLVMRAEKSLMLVPTAGTIPSISGFGFAGASAKEEPGGGWNWEITYEGPSPLEAKGEDAKEDQTVYSFEPADTEIPITSHPDILKFITAFGGHPEDGRVVFGVERPKKADGQSDAAAAADLVNNNKKNPFFGVESYASFGGTWTKSYLARDAMPTNLFDNVEQIVTTVPMPKWFKLPPIGKDRNWLKRMPSFRIRGRSVEITERYILSGRGGHNPYIYTGRNG